MNPGKTVKTGVWGLVIILIIAGGVYSFFQLKADKDFHRIHLFSLIPGNADYVLRIYDQKDSIDNFSNLLPHEIIHNNIFRQICRLGEDECVVSVHPSGNLICSRLSPHSYRRLIHPIGENISPKQENYRNFEIAVVPVKNNNFFCLSYFRGIVLGSSSLKMMRHAIDAYNDSACLLKDNVLNKYIEITGGRVDASLYIRENERQTLNRLIPFRNWLGCDITMQGENYWINGVILNEQTDNPLSSLIGLNENKNENELNLNIIPDNISGLIYIPTDSMRSKPILADSSLARSVENELYICYLEKPDSIPIHPTVILFRLKPGFQDYIANHTGNIIKQNNEIIEQAIPLNSALNNWIETDSFSIVTYDYGYLIAAREKEDLELYKMQMNQKDSLQMNSLLTFSGDLENGKYVLFYSKGETIIPDFTDEGNRHPDNRSFLILLHKDKNRIHYNVISKPS